MITLALAQMVFFFSLQTPRFTGGEDGIQAVPRGKLFGLIDLADDRVLYYVVAAIFLAGLAPDLPHHPLALRPGAARRSATTSRARSRSATAPPSTSSPSSCSRRRSPGLAGATKAIVFQLASLTDVNWSMSGEVVLMTLVGGMGTVFGPIVGAAVIVAMQNYLAQLGAWVLVVQGVIFVVCVLLFREGIVGVIGRAHQAAAVGGHAETASENSP